MAYKASELPPVMALAFLGDAAHSLYIRRMLVARGIAKSGELNDAARPYVSAEGQAEQARRLLPHLTEEERDVYRRAHNSGHLNRPKHASGADYRAATGLEAVIGLLEYTGEADRLSALMKIATEETDTGEDTNDTEN
ncbi:MAG: ribonuclease III [Clostridia bacterium]|nr:ribonuclease III [Clostridia bacterium]